MITLLIYALTHRSCYHATRVEEVTKEKFQILIAVLRRL